MNRSSGRSLETGSSCPGLVSDDPQQSTRFRRNMWIAIAASLPLFGLSTQRLDFVSNGGTGVHLAVPAILVGLLVVCDFLSPRRRFGAPRSMKVDPRLALALTIFLAWHLFETLRADRMTLALREDVKLALGCLCIWAPIHLMPRDPKFVERFWRVVLLSSAAFFALMVVRYLFVFHSSFLGGTFETESRANRNELTWFLMLILPFALARISLERVRVRTMGQAGILLFAWLYAGSRGAWISVIVGIVVALIKTGRRSGLMTGRRLGALFVIIVAIPVAWISMQGIIKQPEAVARLQYLIDPTSVPELHSYPARLGRARSSFDLFLGSPVLGVGLTNDPLRADITGGDVSHNDYVGILSELGIVGFMLFIGVLWLLVRLSWPSSLGGPKQRWMAFGIRASIVAVLVSLTTLNEYTFTLLWLFFGLAISNRSLFTEEVLEERQDHIRGRGARAL